MSTIVRLTGRLKCRERSDSNGRVSRDLDDFHHRSSRGSGHFIRARPQARDEATQRTLQGVGT